MTEIFREKKKKKNKCPLFFSIADANPPRGIYVFRLSRQLGSTREIIATKISVAKVDVIGFPNTIGANLPTR